MSKIIKLTEKELRNIVTGVLSEQQEAYVDETGKAAAGPAPKVLELKRAVKGHLYHAIQNMTQLTHHSGVNPQTNNIVDEIKKVMEKFDHLYGDPKPEQEKEEN